MTCFVGIDLGSTTTKAVVLDESGAVLGRGITNSRSNYDLAAELARTEAFVSARFHLLQKEVEKTAGGAALERLLAAFRLEQMLVQLASLEAGIEEEIEKSVAPASAVEAADAVKEIFRRLAAEEELRFAQTERPARSDFFRDAAGSAYARLSEELAEKSGVTFDLLIGLYDKCIVRVENEPLELGFREHIGKALERAGGQSPVRAGCRVGHRGRAPVGATVGTGYGRARLPFPKEQIRSEILCHGLGAHVLFPGTRTVLDIGGQDTKAIQVDHRAS